MIQVDQRLADHSRRPSVGWAALDWVCVPRGGRPRPEPVGWRLVRSSQAGDTVAVSMRPDLQASRSRAGTGSGRPRPRRLVRAARVGQGARLSMQVSNCACSGVKGVDWESSEEIRCPAAPLDLQVWRAGQSSSSARPAARSRSARSRLLTACDEGASGQRLVRRR